MSAISSIITQHGWRKVRLNDTRDGILATSGKMTLEIKKNVVKVNDRAFSTCSIIPSVDEARSFINDAA